MKIFDEAKLTTALNLLHEQLLLRRAPYTELVVCGGSALIASRLISRTTQDVDVVALMRENRLITAEPLPEYLTDAVRRVADMMHLPADWLNNGPASQFEMGLPPGLAKRLSKVNIGEKLSIYYISRIDQIYFKTFASADRGGYHISDLKALNPTPDELYAAAVWCMGQDVSEAFRFIIRTMLESNGWDEISKRL